MAGAGGRSRNLILAAMIFAVSMTFIDQTIVSGAGMGFMLGPASTDAISRASRLSYGEATGITQTVRNYSASLGFAILGTVLVTKMRVHITSSLISQGLPQGEASAEARRISQSQGAGRTGAIPHFVRLDFAYATRTVLLAMAGVMAVAALVALFGLQRGLQAEPESVTTAPA